MFLISCKQQFIIIEETGEETNEENERHSINGDWTMLFINFDQTMVGKNITILNYQRHNEKIGRDYFYQKGILKTENWYKINSGNPIMIIINGQKFKIKVEKAFDYRYLLISKTSRNKYLLKYTNKIQIVNNAIDEPIEVIIDNDIIKIPNRSEK